MKRLSQRDRVLSSQSLGPSRPRELHPEPLTDSPSRPGELHPESLTEPCLTVSSHTARATH